MIEAKPTLPTVTAWPLPTEAGESGPPDDVTADALEAVRLLCLWGVHSWEKKLATRNPSRLVKRCRRCPQVRVVHLKGQGRERCESNVVFAQFGRPIVEDGVMAAEGARHGDVIYDQRMLRRDPAPPKVEPIAPPDLVA